MIFGLISIASVSAVDDSNTTTDLVSNDAGVQTTLSSDAKNFTDLQNTIDKAQSGQTIELDSNYTYNKGFDINGVKIVNKTVTIVGNNYFLDGNNAARMLNIENSTVTLKGVFFINGYGIDSIGALRAVNSKVDIIDCLFINNVANGTYAKGTYANGFVGGAVYINGNNCNIIRSSFVNNTVKGSGGAIAIDGINNTIDDTYFENNKALHNMNGGAIHVGSGANTKITNNYFISNYAGMSGGAIELQKSSNDLIAGNVFDENRADYGGAVSIYNSGNFTLTKNYFVNNSVVNTTNGGNLGVGGAIRVALADSSKTSTISENDMENNRAATSGGAFYIIGDNIAITNNNFLNNTADKEAAGAVRTLGNNIVISGNDFADNSAALRGGALYLEGNNTEVKNNEFRNNKATSGSDIRLDNSNNVTISKNGFINYKENTSINKGDGSANITVEDNIINFKSFADLQKLINDAANGTIINLTDDYASIPEYVNGVAINNKILTINGNGHILDGKNAGRILNIGRGIIVLNNITFQNGYDDEVMGAIRSIYSQITITNSQFINNNAYGSSAEGKKFATGLVGGAVYILGDNCIISGNKFINNTIGGSGGAIAIDGKNNQILNNYFENNQALRNMNGGAVHVGQGANTLISGNTFVDNFAGMGGGAIELQHSSGDVIRDNIFAFNRADYGGAVSIYNTSSFSLIDNKFLFNTALNTTLGGGLGIGGAVRIYLADSSVKSIISGNNFTTNYANTTGGAMYVYGSNIDIVNNEFNANVAFERAAGAIRTQGSDILISNNKFDSNIALLYGGALYLEGDNTKVTSNIFTDNEAISGSDIRFANTKKGEISNNEFNNYTAYSIFLDKSVVDSYHNKGIVEQTTITAAAKSYLVTKTKSYVITLKDASGRVIAGQKVTLTVNGKTYTATTNAKGQATFNKLSLTKVTSYKAQVKFAGETGYYSAAAKTVTLKTTKEKTKLTTPKKTFKRYAKNKKLTVTLKSNSGVALHKKKVTLKVKGKTYKATSKKGKATFNLKKFTKKGRFTYKVTFKGDSQYYKVTKSGKVTLR